MSITLLASVALERNRLPQAEEFYLEALHIRERRYGQRHPAVAALLNNLGLIHYFQRHYDTAEKYYQRALEMYRATLGPGHASTAGAMGNLAMLYMKKGDLDKVEPLLRDGLEISRKALGPGHQSTSEFLVNLGILHARNKNWPEAAKQFEEALAVQTKAFGESHPNIANSLYSLASVAIHQENAGKAEQSLHRALAIRTQYITANILLLTESGQRDFLKRFASERDFHLTTALGGKSTERLLHLGAESNRLFKGLRLGAQQEVLTRLKRQSDEGLQSLVASIRDYTWRIAAIEGKPGQKDLAVQLKRSREQLQETLVRRIRYEQWRLDVSEKDVQQAVGPKGALIDIAYFKRTESLDESADVLPRWQYAALVYLPEQIQIVDLGEAEGRDGLHSLLNQVLGMDDRLWQNGRLVAPGQIQADLDSKRQPLQSLYERLLGRIRNKLGEERFAAVQHWIISPDGELGSLPWEMLQDSGGKFAIENLLISYVESPRLAVYRSAEAPQGPSVALLDPDYGLPAASNAGSRARLSGSGNLYPLHQGNLAGRFVSSLKGGRIMRGQDASESNLFGLRSPETLLIWTHGEVVPRAEDPLDRPRFLLSGAALVGDRRGAQTGVITARKMMEAHLSGTSLAVIAGCDTGYGTAEAGEGLQSLRRALWVAGAKSQLLTLWPVADLHTVKWLELLYQELATPGLSKVEAVARVQRQFISGKVPQLGIEQRHPYFWSAFTISGEWTPLGR